MIHVTIVVERSVKSISKEANPVLERSSSSKLFALPAVNNGIIHQGWRLVGLLSVVSVCQTEVGRHERTNSSPCQRRSNHQNIIRVSEERPKQRALSSIRESLSRVNAISLLSVDRYPTPSSSSLHLYIRLYCARSVQLHMSPNVLANSAH